MLPLSTFAAFITANGETPAAPQMCVSCGRRSGIARNTPLRSIVCEPCWFAHGGDATPTELVGHPATPESVLPRTGHDWSRALLASSWFRQRRSDSARRVTLLARALVLRADWESHTTWPTWERLMEATGWSRSTMSGWLAELHRHGWLRRVEGGSTPRFRPMALDGIEGNRAAVYQLRIPVATTDSRCSQGIGLTGKTRTPTHFSSCSISSQNVLLTRAKDSIHNFTTKPQVTSTKEGPNGPSLDEEEQRYFDHRVPVSRAQMLAAAAELRSADPALRRLTNRWVRALMATWWRAGWTNSDLLLALDRRPGVGGTQASDRCPAAQLRRPDGWVRHRLSHWMNETGPMPAPRRWERTQNRVRTVHGAAAAARLPYGATTLQPEDLAQTAADRAAAAQQLVRQWAREFHDQRDARRPDHEVADPQTARRFSEQARRSIKRAAPDSDPMTSDTARETDPELPKPSPTPSASAEIYQRALEVARAQGRAPLRRNNRRGWRR